MADSPRTIYAPLGPPRRNAGLGAELAPSVPYDGTIGVSKDAPTPDEQAQMDLEEAAGAGNLLKAWQESEQLRAGADDAVRQFQAGKMNAADTAAAIERYNAHREKWIDQKPVQPPRWSMFDILFGGR